MRVFHESPNMLVIVQPGTEHPETTEFVDAEGTPILFSVQFKNGVARVIDPLGRFMLNKGLAKRSAIILPEKE